MFHKLVCLLLTKPNLLVLLLHLLTHTTGTPRARARALLLKSQAEAAAAINPNSTKLAQTNKTRQQKRRKMGGDAQAGVVFFLHNCAMGTASAHMRDTNTIGLLECDHATFRIHCTKCDEERRKYEKEREDLHVVVVVVSVYPMSARRRRIYIPCTTRSATALLHQRQDKRGSAHILLQPAAGIW
jgi:hypothetical protein